MSAGRAVRYWAEHLETMLTLMRRMAREGKGAKEIAHALTVGYHPVTGNHVARVARAYHIRLPSGQDRAYLASKGPPVPRDKQNMLEREEALAKAELAEQCRLARAERKTAEPYKPKAGLVDEWLK